MASNIARVGSGALSELKKDLIQLSNALHEIYDLMNADMRNVHEYWQDNKYQEFVQHYQTQIKKCEQISNRYSEWCSKVLVPTIENVIAVEITDVGGGVDAVDGVSAAGVVGGTTAAAVGGTMMISGFKLGMGNAPKPTTKAVPISNGCGSEEDPKSFAAASIGRAMDTKLKTGDRYWKIPAEWKAQGESCDIHDKCYYQGLGKDKCDSEFQQRSRVMGTAVIMAKETSGKSYEQAQQDRLLSEHLQATWEEEHHQKLDTENFRVVPND